MQFNRRNIICLLCVAVLMLLAFDAAKAQSKKLEAAVIAKAKNTLVSQIEKGLPPQPFAVWFREIVGKKPRITWEVNDCGEQTGDPSVDKGRDFPMCVDANAKVSADFVVSVNVQYGTFKRGITRMKPVVRSLTVGDEIGGNWLDKLSDLPEYLAGSNKKSEYLNPTGGVFKLSGTQPAGFENIDGLLIRTMDYNGQEKNTYIESYGGIRVGQIFYAISGFIVEGENVHFETMKINGVSFSFLGKLAKSNFDSAGLNSEKALSGRLIKLVNGVKTAEADLSFDFVMNKNPVVSDQSMKISEIKKLNPAAGNFTTRGFVVINRACPPCPPGNACKPCENRILISEENKRLDTYEVTEKEMTVAAENPQEFVKGKEYIFKIKIIERKSTGDSLNDVHLISYKIIE